MNPDDIDDLIAAAYTVASCDLDALRTAASTARAHAERLHITTDDEEQMTADVTAYAALNASAEMLDLLVTYRQVQAWQRHDDQPIDLTHDHQDTTNGNGEQHQ